MSSGEIEDNQMHGADGDASAEIKTVDFKREGNQAFVDGKMYEAIQAYTKRLEIDETDVETLSNRAAAYLRIKLYEKAKQDLTKAMELEGTLLNVKTVYRLCKSFWGLQEYNEAIHLLEDVYQLYHTAQRDQDKSMILKLTETSKNLKYESTTGQYNMPELIHKKYQTYDCAEYIGPVKIADVPGKGRGLIATKYIRAGQVLIGSTAFAIVFPTTRMAPAIAAASKWKINEQGEHYKEDPKHEELVKNIVNLLTLNPGLKKEFFQLYAGPKLGHLEETEGIDINEDLVMDRINKICYYNAFFSASNPNPNQIPDPNEVDEIRNANTYGIWLLPSYLNHTCVNVNCDVQKYGNFMIIRALRDIAVGEELLISYTFPTTSYNERKADIQGYGFTCTCRLCQIEESESDETHQKRAELMHQFLETCANNPNESPKPIEDIKSQLEALRQEKPELNWALFWVNRQIGSLAINLLDYEKAARCFEASHWMSRNTSLHREGIRFALQALLCHANTRKKPDAREWANIFKLAVISAYGTLDVIPAIAARERLPTGALILIMKEYIEDFSLTWKNSS